MAEHRKPLTRGKPAELVHYAGGKRHPGPSRGLSGDCTCLSGDCSGLIGDCTGLRGNCSDLRGDCTGLSGDCSGLSGDLDEIPYSARPCNIADWAGEASHD